MKSLSTLTTPELCSLLLLVMLFLILTTVPRTKSNEDRILFSINDFDYGDLKGKHDILWDFYGLFSEPELSVFYAYLELLRN